MRQPLEYIFILSMMVHTFRRVILIVDYIFSVEIKSINHDVKDFVWDFGHR